MVHETAKHEKKKTDEEVLNNIQWKEENIHGTVGICTLRSLPSKVVSNVVCDIVSIPHLLE